MQYFPARIPTNGLKLSDVPDESAAWQTIGRFALTFDPAEKDPYHPSPNDPAAVSSASSLTDLRAHLFFEQRRWNHFGRLPDAAAMLAIRRLIGLIRAKLLEYDKTSME